MIWGMSIESDSNERELDGYLRDLDGNDGIG